MRTLLILPCLFISVFAFGQKNVTKTEGHLKLPMQLWEYYATDSLSFFYNGLNRLQSYAYCNNNDSGIVPGFSKLQQNLLDAGTLLNGHEGGIGYALIGEDNPAAKGIEALKALGLSKAAKTITEYAEFAQKNAEAFQNGDEAIMTKSWYYDSLFMDQVNAPDQMGALFNHLRNSGMFIRADGKPFAPNQTGTAKITDKAGNRIEEIGITNGFQTGSTYQATLNGKPSSEMTTNGDWNINKYYFQTGALASYDSINNVNGMSFTKSYFPNGKLNSDISNTYTFDDQGNFTGGGASEKAYYANGKLSCEVFTNHLGEMKILSGVNQKGKTSIERGSGKLYRETIDVLTGLSNISVTEYSNHIPSGINEMYVNGKLTSSYEMQNGIINGSQKMFHWKNGKIINEMVFDQTGNYVEDKNTFEQNAPKIDPSKIKISIELEPDQICNTHGIWNPGFTRATLSNEKAAIKGMLTNYNLLHYNTDNLTPQDPQTAKYLTLDLDEQGNVYNNTYEEKDGELVKLFQFTPAKLDGKAIKSRVNLVVYVNW
jgi:antitoxin component YwqK of YwqJK toxin-antitoxin module